MVEARKFLIEVGQGQNILKLYFVLFLLTYTVLKPLLIPVLRTDHHKNHLSVNRYFLVYVLYIAHIAYIYISQVLTQETLAYCHHE